MTLLLAASPVLLSAGALLFARQSATRAGLLGLLTAIVLALALAQFRLMPAALLDAVLRGALTTLVVAYVLLGGVLLYQVMRAGGALETLSAAVARAIPDPAHRLFTLVLGVSVFFESATGFGIGIVVCAPLFLALGFTPLRAAFLALLGQCAVPWGALAIGTILGSQLSGVPASVLGTLGVLLSWPFILLCGALAMVVAGQWRPLPKRALQLLAYAALLCAVLWLASLWVGVELAGILAGLAVTLLGLLSGRRAPVARRDSATQPEERRPQGALARALLPVSVLLLGLLLTRLWPALRELSSGLLVFEVERLGFALPLLHHPGFWMLLGAITGVFALSLSGSEVVRLSGQALRQWAVATLAVAGFLCMAQVMFDAGMIAALAERIAAALGANMLLLMPFIGALGGFLTASNAGANAMFMQFQVTSAQALAFPSDAVAAAQNAAAANATLASPGRVVLAATVTQCTGQEGRLLRWALPVVLAGTLPMPLILMWLIG
ncbi:L-lactate permease [Aquibaculum arenosum]|uniref:L-lactate permease n=1 Tax=Aquibaculum arenosum TaxID=3032591 RepID=A0ABT5YNN8_9PROT|nr:L-lactate permease [Fodinicurvata sp. CAU 1616]MDF2096438.1 L-lactate permease [Fodinicurvata sp. CAU 1616]